LAAIGTLKRKRKMKKKILDNLLMYGEFMSNILFNAKQDGTIPENYRRHFKEYQEKWDKAYRDYHDFLDKQKVTRKNKIEEKKNA
jgi:hypothetical protein